MTGRTESAAVALAVNKSLTVVSSALAAAAIFTGLMERLKNETVDTGRPCDTAECYRIAQMGEWVAERLTEELEATQKQHDKAGWR